MTLSTAAMILNACWGETIPFPAGDLDTSSDSKKTEVPVVEPLLIEGGGTGNGKINGYVNLHLIDEVSGTPIRDAKVMLNAKGVDSLTGETNANGLLVLRDEHIKGPVDLHIITKNHVPESVLSLNAINTTIPLRPKENPPESETANISGKVSNFGLITPPKTGEQRVGLIYYDLAMDEMVTMRNPNFAAHQYFTKILPDSEGDTFSLTVPASRGVLYAIAGKTGNLGTADPSDDTHNWILLGTDLTLEPQPGEHIKDVEISLNQNLSKMFLLRETCPEAFDVVEGYLGLDMGEPGTIWLEAQSLGFNTGYAVPNLDLGLGSPLEAGKVTLVSQSKQELDAGVEPDDLNTMPQAFRFDIELESLGDYEKMPFQTGTKLSPPFSSYWDGKQFTCLSIPAPQLMGRLTFENPDNETVYWRVTAFGGIPGEIKLPDFPSNWQWSSVPATDVLIKMWIARFQISPNNMKFDNFSQNLSEIVFDNILVAQ